MKLHAYLSLVIRTHGMARPDLVPWLVTLEAQPPPRTMMPLLYQIRLMEVFEAARKAGKRVVILKRPSGRGFANECQRQWEKLHRKAQR